MRAGNFGNDALSAGNGDDTLDGDNVADEGPAADPNPNSDSCAGGKGENQFFFCETQSEADWDAPRCRSTGAGVRSR